MKPGLLDVNVLISLIDPAHEFHDPVHVWFQRNRKYGWATCLITENGCVRVMSKSAYPNGGITPSQVREVLAVFGTADDHLFWPDALSLLDSGLFNLNEAGPKNITDAYLLGLARFRGGRLVTFDRKIRPQWVTGAGDSDLELILRNPALS